MSNKTSFAETATTGERRAIVGTQIDWMEFHKRLAERQRTIPAPPEGYRAVPAYILVPLHQPEQKRHWLESGLALGVAAAVLLVAGVSLGLVLAGWLF